MADDVETARQLVIEHLCDCDPTGRFNHASTQCRAEGVKRLDALIAAVRAEQSKGPAGSFGYCPVCYHPLDGCSNCGPS